MRVSFIKKHENKLLVYIKKSCFRTQFQINEELEQFKDDYISYLGWKHDITGKYIIAEFVLRNIADIKPYIKE